MWLSLLSVKTVKEAEALVDRYPELEEIFVEMAEFMYKPEEVLAMYSEALNNLDRNTSMYMVDYMKERADRLEDENSGLKNENLAVYKSMIHTIRQFNGTKESAINKLISDCGKPQAEAEELVEKYWE